MKSIQWLCVAMLLGLAGCEKYVLSVHPLCTDETSVAVPALEGKWASDDAVWGIAAGGGNTYQVRVSDMLNVGEFTGRVRAIGDRQYLCLTPNGHDFNAIGFYAAHWIDVHSFSQMQLSQDQLGLRCMSADPLKSLLEETPNLIQWTSKNDHVILTDNTESLVQFVQAHADVNELWASSSDFVRCRPLYTQQDLVLNQNLVGQWVDPNNESDGSLNITLQGDHYDFQFVEEEGDAFHGSVHVFKKGDRMFMGVFVGPEAMRAKEMKTLMPDWFCIATLDQDRMTLQVLTYAQAQALIAHPDKLDELKLDDLDATLVRIK